MTLYVQYILYEYMYAKHICTKLHLFLYIYIHSYKQALKAKELHGSKRSFSKSANHVCAVC